jgi:nucleoside-diphosphate-sugar epimerase
MILVTGANGFLGQAIVRRLHDDFKAVRGTVREPKGMLFDGAEYVLVGNLDLTTDWSEALRGVNAVIHTAARAHVMHETSDGALSEFRRVNVDGSLSLARQAIFAGVKRFIFISSIKVNGEGGEGVTYRFDDTAAPEDDYGISKWEAEEGLKALCSESEMELVVIRPTLIYGPGVKGNLALLEKAIDRKLPLPLGMIKNQRDILSLNNLIDLIKTCIHHPAAGGNIFLCCDNDSVSTPQLIQLMAQGRGKNVLLFPVPVSVLNIVAKLMGRQAMMKRLSSDFRVDIEHTINTLNWEPPFSVEESMQWGFSRQS